MRGAAEVGHIDIVDYLKRIDNKNNISESFF